MKKKWIAWMLLAAIALSFVGCAKPDELKGTWRMVSSMRHKERAEEIKNGAFAKTYTFDGHGRGTETVLHDGKPVEVSFRYELVNNGSPYIRFDYGLRTPYAFVGDMLQMQIFEANGERDYFVFERVP